MKNINEIVLAIKMEIRSKVKGCECNYKGQKKRIADFRSFSNEFEFIEKFDLAEIPISGPVVVNTRFIALVNIDIDGNIKDQSYVKFQYGPLLIDYEAKSYNLDSSQATIRQIIE